MFVYVINCIFEILDELYKIDDVMKVGFGWEYGFFEIWDVVGFDKGLEFMEVVGKKFVVWIKEMKDVGVMFFYIVKDGVIYYYDIL